MMSWDTANVCLLAAILGAGSIGSPVHAADGKGAKASGDTALEEIIVTAERREESLQKTAVTVTAVSGAALEAVGGTGVSDLNGLVPGLIINDSMGVAKVPSIRGLGNEAPEGAPPSSVATHIDGSYIWSGIALNGEFLDVDRVEVLPGPQGPVYGQTSTGGALNIISKAPKLGVTEGLADLSIGSYDLVRVNAAANLPVSDTVAIRAAFLSNKHRGFGAALNVPGNQRYPLDDDSSEAARLSVLLQPTDALSVVGRFYYSRTNASAREMKNVLDPVADPRTTSSDYGTPLFIKTQIGSLTVHWNVGFAELSSISSVVQSFRDAPLNNDGLDYALASQYYPSPPFGHDLIPTQKGGERSAMQEFDLTSTPNSLPFRWLVGAFYHHYVEDGAFLEYQVANNSTPILPLEVLNPKSAADLFAVIGNGFEAKTNLFRTQWSTFGQVDYKITDRLTLTGGIRYNADRSTGKNFVFVDYGSVIPQHSNSTTWKGALSFQATPDSLEYLTVSTGYKPGGTNIIPGTISGAAIVPPAYQPEKNTGYEIGTKNEFLNHAVRLNVSAYYYDYKNLQLTAQDPFPFNGGTDNVPKSTIKGVEAAFLAKVADGWFADLSLEYEQAKIDSHYLALDPSTAAQILVQEANLGHGIFDPNTIAAREAAAKDTNGNEVPKVPRFSGNASLSDRILLGNGASLTARASVAYRGAYHYNVSGPDFFNRVPSSTIGNLNLRYEPASAPWSAELMVLNVADRADLTTKNTDAFGVGATFMQYVPPRQIIGKVAYKF